MIHVDAQKKWLLIKETWLRGSKQVWGMKKGPLGGGTEKWKRWLSKKKYGTKPN